MDAKDREFAKRLRDTFRAEAEEHVQAIAKGLVGLEKSPSPERRAELTEGVFRESHSLKGAARAVNHKDIESICQSLESVFSALGQGGLAPSRGLFDILHGGLDAINGFLASRDMEGSAEEREAAGKLVKVLGEAMKPPAAAALPAGAAPAVTVPHQETPESRGRASGAPLQHTGTLRISAEKLDSLLLQAEEMSAMKIAADQRTLGLRDILRDLREGKAEAMRWKESETAALSPLCMERYQRNESFLAALEDRAASLVRDLERDRRTTRRMVDEHLEEMKGAVMLPVSSLTESFPKIVRDLARDTGKEAGADVRGDDIEIDKRILDEMRDPLIHLLRNGVDHGIEPPEKRAALGKAPRGTVRIAFAAKGGGRVEISVSDDGAGIDLEKLRSAAEKSGIISGGKGKGADPEEGISLIFKSGITTSPIITDVSGRGLGLAIVREKVEELGGTVRVDTLKDSGTDFRILLPMTLSAFRGIIVRSGGGFFALPMMNAERALRLGAGMVKTVENREMISLKGQAFPLARLSEALGLPRLGPGAGAGRGGAPSPAEYLYVIVLKSMGKRIGFQVDEIVGEQQVMVKSLGSQLPRVRNLAGAAILGDGRVVPVLNVPDLMESADFAAAAARPSGTRAVEAPGKRRVLVAEDSITTRLLLKNLLESAGYSVTVAVDGADAFMKALEGDFDILVSDVDMPRMSGFELTSKIRRDKRLSGLPVVLVTALESREDRERGIEAGANAYIVKSSFDQGNLLETIGRLL